MIKLLLLLGLSFVGASFYTHAAKVIEKKHCYEEEAKAGEYEVLGNPGSQLGVLCL